MATTAELVETSQSARSADELLRSSVSVLLGVTPAAAAALAGLDINTIQFEGLTAPTAQVTVRYFTGVLALTQVI